MVHALLHRNGPERAEKAIFQNGNEGNMASEERFSGFDSFLI